MPDKIYSISELTKEIKSILEGSFLKVWVEGEISNYTHHSSGHRYFTLKDQDAQIRCVMWKWIGKHLFFEPQDGIKVKASGQVTVYEKSGQYQLAGTVISAVEEKIIGGRAIRFRTKETSSRISSNHRCGNLAHRRRHSRHSQYYPAKSSLD
jgi:exodeoxyribonuclease VII large subunit